MTDLISIQRFIEVVFEVGDEVMEKDDALHLYLAALKTIQKVYKE